MQAECVTEIKRKKHGCVNYFLLAVYLKKRRKKHVTKLRMAPSLKNISFENYQKKEIFFWNCLHIELNKS